jgi:hypothetical protein
MGAPCFSGVASFLRRKGVEEGVAGMTTNMVRWGGLAGVAAGVMFVLSGILTLIAPPQKELGSFGGYLIEVVIVVAFALAMVAIAGLHAAHRLSGRYGGLGAAGALLTLVGYALVLVAAHVTTRVGGEPIYTVRLVGGVGVLFGSILLGAMTLRARLLPWWCGVLLLVGFPLGDILEGVVGMGSESIALGIVWGTIGYALLSQSSTAAERPSRVS